jgi:hypothetical protein
MGFRFLRAFIHNIVLLAAFLGVYAVMFGFSSMPATIYVICVVVLLVGTIFSRTLEERERLQLVLSENIEETRNEMDSLVMNVLPRFVSQNALFCLFPKTGRRFSLVSYLIQTSHYSRQCRPIAMKLKNNEPIEPTSYQCVTVLFVAICGIQEVTIMLRPTELVCISILHYLGFFALFFAHA